MKAEALVQSPWALARWLVLAPHPDDEVYGCGGAVALHVQAGHRVHVVILTDGAGQAGAPEVRERMTAIGFDVVAGTPEEFGQFMKAEVERWTKVVERGAIKPE